MFGVWYVASNLQVAILDWQTQKGHVNVKSHIILRSLVLLLTVATLVSHPVLTRQAPTIEGAELETIQLLGFSLSDLCAAGEEDGGHVHCEACLADVVSADQSHSGAAIAAVRCSDKTIALGSIFARRANHSPQQIRAPPVV